MDNKVQKLQPKRTCTKIYERYQSYKQYLKDDFNQRCGYCDAHDFLMGGWRNFHIDHFKPQNNKDYPEFKALKSDYKNLVYCCFYCNNAKSNKWKNNNGFIDPCADEYNLHLCRNSRGQIKHRTIQGKYIYENLNLGLIRHELIWMIQKLNVQKNELDQLLNANNSTEKELELIREFRKLQEQVDSYYNLYKQEIQ